MDGFLSDEELRQFQLSVFDVNLDSKDIASIKKVLFSSVCVVIFLSEETSGLTLIVEPCLFGH